MVDEVSLLHGSVARVWPDVEQCFSGSELAAFESKVLVGLRSVDARAVVPGADVDGAGEALLALFEPYPALLHRVTEELNVLALLGERAGSKSDGLDGTSLLRRLEVPVFYATNRLWQHDVGFIGYRGDLLYGGIQVPIADDHRLGTHEKPRGWRLRLRSKPTMADVLGGPVPFDAQEFAERVSKEAQEAERPEALVFVHGYNVGFREAARRTAQLAYDLQFAGVSLFYSWPSRGTVRGYLEDGDNAHWSAVHFLEFLTGVLTQTSVEKVHVVAHSMGNRVLVGALSSLDPTALPAGAGRLGQVVFAAPDVDAGVFVQAVPGFRGKAERCTLYASSRDKALAAARKLAGYPRAGQSGQGLVVVDGVDTVDASNLDTGLMSHSYFGDHTSVLMDLHGLLRHQQPPAQRFGLRAVRHPAGCYWSFDPLRG